MHKFLSLTNVTLKNTLGMVSDGKSKKISAILIYAILFISLIPLAFLLFMMFLGAFQALAPLDQAGSVLAIAFHLSSFITFIFSIFLIPSVYYFSKDGETLLALPISAQAILGSKFVVCLLYEYVFTFFILVPAFAAYMCCFPFSIIRFLFALITFLLIPLYPLVLSSIISMLVMRFVPFFKNRDRFNVIAGFATLIIALGFSFAMNSIPSNMEPEVLLTTLVEGNNSLINFFGYLFCAVPFAARAILHADMIQFLIFIAINAAAVLIFLFLGKVLYFKGLIGFSETSSTRKKLSDKDVAKLTHKKNRILTYTIKELKLLIRTPIYMMNCISTSFIFPILIFILPMLEDKDSIPMDMIPQNFSALLMEYWPYIIIAGFVLGFFIGNLNMISCTSISREGTNISFMKYIPMPIKDQLLAKLCSGIIIAFLTDILMLLALYIVFPILPLSIFLIVFITSLITIIFANFIGLYIDIAHPKLVWEQEAVAVKQNMSSFVAMMGGMAIAAILVAVAIFVPFEFIKLADIGILLVLIIGSVLLYLYLETFAKKAFDKY